MRTQVERYGEVRSVLLYAEIRAVISLKWPVIRPHYATIRWSYTVTFRYTAVGNRIATVHGRITGHFNDITVRISAYNNTERMRTRMRPVLFVLGCIRKWSYPSVNDTEKYDRNTEPGIPLKYGDIRSRRPYLAVYGRKRAWAFDLGGHRIPCIRRNE